MNRNSAKIGNNTNNEGLRGRGVGPIRLKRKKEKLSSLKPKKGESGKKGRDKTNAISSRIMYPRCTKRFMKVEIASLGIEGGSTRMEGGNRRKSCTYVQMLAPQRSSSRAFSKIRRYVLKKNCLHAKQGAAAVGFTPTTANVTSSRS